MESVTLTHKGTTYSASSLEAIQEMIKENEYERSIFHRKSVYTYNCHARTLSDGTVEYVQYFNNYDSKTVTTFSSVDDFYKSLN